MRLTHMLQQPGGVSEQGKEVLIRLRYLGPRGVPHVREVAAVMLPISEVQQHQIARAAQASADTDGLLPGGAELVVRLLQVSLRDPGDLSKLLIEDETDLQALRDGLVAVQYERLLDHYRALIKEEYSADLTEEELAALEREAQDFSEGGQPSPG